MTIAQRKNELINWIKDLTSEESIRQLEKFRQSNATEFPKELIELLKIADQESTEGLRKHTSVIDIVR